jgi:hypothetical protein
MAPRLLLRMANFLSYPILGLKPGIMKGFRSRSRWMSRKTDGIRQPGRSRRRIWELFNRDPATACGSQRSLADRICRKDDLVCGCGNGLLHDFARRSARIDQHRDRQRSATG